MKDELPVFNHTGHKELWLWLAKNPTRRKWEWPGWVYNGGRYEREFSDCFACAPVGAGNCFDCECPLVWNTDTCIGDGGYYRRYQLALDSCNAKLVTRLAKKIASLPVQTDKFQCI